MNKKINRRAGYTIVEVMIFLAVSSALFVSTMLVMSGQQRKQEFYQAVREADSKIRDVINDFSTGYFPDATNFTCSADGLGSAPVIAVGTDQQGKREGCAFIGKVVHFAPASTNSEAYRIVTIVGRQFKGAPLTNVVENIVEAKPVALATAGVDEQNVFGYGLKVQKMTYTDGSGLEQPVGAIGFFSSFADIENGDTVSGKQTTQTIVIPTTVLNQTSGVVNTAIGAIGSANWNTFRTAYVSRPVTICLVGNTNQHALIKIGDNNRQVTTSVTVGGGSTCP